MVNKTSNTINQFPVFKDIEDWKMDVLTNNFLTKIKRIIEDVFSADELINIERDSKLNVKIGFAFLIATLSFIAMRNKNQLKLSKIQELNLLYALEYRDLSKEAIMAIAESLIS